MPPLAGFAGRPAGAFWALAQDQRCAVLEEGSRHVADREVDIRRSRT